MTNLHPAPIKSTPRQVARVRAVMILTMFLALGGFLYVKEDQSAKKTLIGGACAATAKTARAISPLAKGEVAAMAIADQPGPMPDLAFNGPDGKPMTLADFKGRTLLLNVWATWCVPCRQEMAALDRLQQLAGSDTFEVVAINVDTSRLDRPKSFLNELGVKHLAYYADPKADIFYRLKQTGDVLGLPTTILVDPSGCQIGRMAGPAAWDSAEARALVRGATQAGAGGSSGQNAGKAL